MWVIFIKLVINLALFLPDTKKQLQNDLQQLLDETNKIKHVLEQRKNEARQIHTVSSRYFTISL